MSSSAAVIQVQHRDAFEQNVTRALAAGAGAGLLYYFTSQKLGLTVPLSFLVLAGTSLACVRGSKWDRLLLSALSVTLPALPWLFGLSLSWTVGLAGVAAGLLMVRSRITEKGPEGSVAADRPGPLHYALTGAATGGLALAGTEVARILSSRLTDIQTPTPVNFAVSGTVLALFAGLGSIAAHIALKSDPVDARGEELLPLLSGEFHDLAARALGLYRLCGEQLAALPREPAREELARTVSRLTKDAFDLVAEWSGVEAQLHDSAEKDLQVQVAELSRSAATARDLVAKKQLELAADSLKEELTRLEEMKLKRERIVARLKSQVALLERARVALIGMRSSHATVRAAELSAVSRKLNALAVSQADEAKLAHEVATGVDLAAVEAQAAESKLRQQLASVPSPSAPAPVSAVTEELAAPPAPAEKEKA